MKDVVTEIPSSTDPSGPEDSSGKMSFLEHLDELRQRLIRVALYLAVGFTGSFYFSKQIYQFIAVPIRKALPPNLNLVITNPTEGFTLYVKVALLTSVFVTVPLSLYEVWRFIAPGLYRREKKYVVPFMASSIILFLAGGAFCYYIVLTPAFTILLQWASDFTPMIKATEYMDLTLTMLLGFGLVFEMPVIVAFLSMFGLVSAKFLWTKFKYAIVIMVAAAAVLSPTGDAINLLIWSGPMIVLYLLSIGIAALFGARRRKMERS